MRENSLKFKFAYKIKSNEKTIFIMKKKKIKILKNINFNQNSHHFPLDKNPTFPHPYSLLDCPPFSPIPPLIFL